MARLGMWVTFLGIILTLAGFALRSQLPQPAQQDARWGDWPEVAATITGKSVRKEDSAGKILYRSVISYRYTAGGRSFTGESADRDGYEDHQMALDTLERIGTEIRIRHDPNDPAISRFGPDAQPQGGLASLIVLMLFSGPLLFVLGLIFHTSGRRAARQMKSESAT